jgi:hypothetical protein
LATTKAVRPRDWAALAGRDRAGLAGNNFTGCLRSTLRATAVAMAIEETDRNVVPTWDLRIEKGPGRRLYESLPEGS